MDFRKNDKITLTREDLAIFSLIKEGILGACKRLMGKNETLSVLENYELNGEFMPYSLGFAAPEANLKLNSSYDLLCEGEKVGKFTLLEKFTHKNDVRSIFSPNYCFVGENSFISGEFELEKHEIADIRAEFERVKSHTNAQKITAIFANLNPLHRAHERIFRWTIDKADIIVIFLTQSYEPSGLEFELKLATLRKFIELYLPKERVFVFPLRNLHIFNAPLTALLQVQMAKNLGCTKIIFGQNHAGLGLYYENNCPKTIFNEFESDFGIEVVVLPEFVYCNKCKISVSVRSCPHGSHHHIKFHPNSLKDLLRTGLVPPTIFMRREISAMILSELFPARFARLQNIYNDLFPNDGLVATHEDADFYEQLLNMYQMTYMV